MKAHDINRRQFLRLLISLPLAYTIGCEPEKPATTVQEHLLSPKESLKKLIFLLGPWTVNDKKEAEDFARRFLKAEHTVGPYLHGSSKLVQSLASRFPAGTMAVKEINLQQLPAREQELLTNLVKQLYSFIEVRFYVSKEPPWGECQGDSTWYTRAPVSSKI